MQQPENEQQSDIELFRKWRWPNGVHCPRCGVTEIYEIKGRGIYRCASSSCGSQFSDTSGTVFSARKLSYGEMIDLIRAIEKGGSINSIAKKSGFNWRTVKMMKHKMERL